MRFWMSWWAGDGKDMRPVRDDDSVPPWACSGEREQDPRYSICAVVEADSEEGAWNKVLPLWPEAEQRFCNHVADDYAPSDRFQCIVDKMKERGMAVAPP